MERRRVRHGSQKIILAGSSRLTERIIHRDRELTRVDEDNVQSTTRTLERPEQHFFIERGVKVERCDHRSFDCGGALARLAGRQEAENERSARVVRSFA